MVPRSEGPQKVRTQGGRFVNMISVCGILLCLLGFQSVGPLGAVGHTDTARARGMPLSP